MSSNSHRPIPEKPFGGSGRSVTMVGLGGEGVLRTFGREQESRAVIEEALSQGISYFDSARAYSDSENYYGMVWHDRPKTRMQIFQTSKSAMRSKKDALADLDQTLKNLKIDHLDLWQIHDVRTQDDLRAISARGGALEAFVQAKAQGKARLIGVTGHHDPDILTRAVTDWPVDSVLLPVNPVEGVLGGFLDQTLQAAQTRGVAVVGMKALGASFYLSPQTGLDAVALLRFALSQPVTLVVVGCSTPQEVKTLADIARRFQPMSHEEQRHIVGLYRPHAKRLAYYRGVL
jgi:predicted aldo/keto reductase-like oxidoreductase